MSFCAVWSWAFVVVLALVAFGGGLMQACGNPIDFVSKEGRPDAISEYNLAPWG